MAKPELVALVSQSYCRGVAARRHQQRQYQDGSEQTCHAMSDVAPPPRVPHIRPSCIGTSRCDTLAPARAYQEAWAAGGLSARATLHPIVRPDNCRCSLPGGCLRRGARPERGKRSQPQRSGGGLHSTGRDAQPVSGTHAARFGDRGRSLPPSQSGRSAEPCGHAAFLTDAARVRRTSTMPLGSRWSRRCTGPGRAQRRLGRERRSGHGATRDESGPQC